MVGFKREAFDKKLATLNDSQQSIQTVSLWVIHHRKHYKEIVQFWLEQLKKETKNRQLTYIYLANDVIQNSRKKLPQFSKEFLRVLPPAFEHISRDVDDRIKGKIERVINIWDERAIYDKKDINQFQTILKTNSSSDGGVRAAQSNGDSSNNTSTLSHSTPQNINRKRKSEDSRTPGGGKRSLIDELDSKTMKAMLQKILKYTALEVPINNDIVNGNIEPDKLIKSLKELESCPSSDEDMKKKILSLPSEVYDVTLIDAAIKRDGSTDKWLETVNEAQKTLKDYNQKLTQEIEDRTNSFSMLVKYLDQQKEHLKEAERSLGETKEKLKKCDSVRDELRSHIASLPDLSQLPQLALPSAMDLFQSKHS